MSGIEVTKIFNTPEEVGIRVLLILSQSMDAMDLQRLVYYDYFLLHLNDILKDQDSIHPSNPYHATEIAIKRKLIQEGINLMSKKGLIDIHFSIQGISYSRNKMTIEFLEYFDSNYFNKLEKNARIVEENFNTFTDEKIQNYVYENIGKWTGEFESESLS